MNIKTFRTAAVHLLLTTVCFSGWAFAANADAGPNKSNDPVGALGYVAGQIMRCDQYKTNYGTEHPYQENCVNLQVESTDIMIQAILGKDGSQAHAALQKIKGCPHLSNGSPGIRPYSESCVSEVVAQTIKQIEATRAKYRADAALNAACRSNKLVGEIRELQADNQHKAQQLEQVMEVELKISEEEQRRMSKDASTQFKVNGAKVGN